MSPPGTIRVVLCDDHVMVREGLKRVIEGVDGIEVVASASDGAEGIEATVRLRPDVVLMDLAMPGVDGVEATRRIAAEVPETSVVVLTSFAEQTQVLDAIDAGASGYVLKDASVDEVVRAIHTAAAGDSPLDPRVARAVVARSAGADPFAALSDREREVLEPHRRRHPEQDDRPPPRHHRADRARAPDADLPPHRRRRPHPGRALGGRARHGPA